MSRDDIIRLAREAMIGDTGVRGDFIFFQPGTGGLERFAAIVAAAEREECARFLESGVDLKGLAGDQQMQAFCGALLMGCAKAIRARGEA